MNLSNEFEPIREWAEAKGIYRDSTDVKQNTKLGEEFIELQEAMIEDDQDRVEDAIGDCIVCLTNLAHLRGTSIEECINGAYGVISKRKGKMVDGLFVKDGE